MKGEEMKVEFEIKQKVFTSPEGKEVKYYVLVKRLVDGTELEIAVKGDKAKLLLMSLAVEKQQNK